MVVDEEKDVKVKAQVKHGIDGITTSTSEGKRIFPQMESILTRPKKYCEELFEKAIMELSSQYYDAIDNADLNIQREREEEEKAEIKENQIKATQFKNLLRDHDMKLFEYIYNRAEWFAGAEQKNVLTGVLCHISTMNGYPIWFLPLGRAGEGKSFIEEASLLFVPKSHIVNGLKTKAVLFRLSTQLGSNYLDRKILTMKDLGEKEDYLENRAVMKTYKKLTTEGYDDYEITGDGIDPRTGERTLLTLHLTGKPSVCFTSVQSEGIDDQFLSRGVTVTPTATDEEAIEFMTYMEEGMSSRKEHDRIIKDEMPLFHGFIKDMLHEHKDDKVLNPYYECLVKWIKLSEFVKRDMGKYTNLVKVVTLLHANEREFIEIDGRKIYLSTEEDNQIVGEIFNPSTGLSGDAIAVFNRLVEIYDPYNSDELNEYTSYDQDRRTNLENYDTIFSINTAKNRLKNTHKFRGLPMGEIFSSLSKIYLDAVGKVQGSKNNNVYAIGKKYHHEICNEVMNFDEKIVMKYLDKALPFYDPDRSTHTSEILKKIENEVKASEYVLSKMERPPWILQGCFEGCLNGVRGVFQP